MTAGEPTTGRNGEACVICGSSPAEHEGDGEMVHDFVELDDQCPIISRRCDRPCGSSCIRGQAAEADSAGEEMSDEELLDLQADLDKLERTDPDVAAAAESYDRMVERITGRTLLPRPAVSPGGQAGEESIDLTPGDVWTDQQLAVVRQLTARAFRAEQAVERVEALADQLDRDAECTPVAALSENCAYVADRIRRALDPS
jgi:hypothetical protein